MSFTKRIVPRIETASERQSREDGLGFRISWNFFVISPFSPSAWQQNSTNTCDKYMCLDAEGRDPLGVLIWKICGLPSMTLSVFYEQRTLS